MAGRVLWWCVMKFTLLRRSSSCTANGNTVLLGDRRCTLQQCYTSHILTAAKQITAIHLSPTSCTGTFVGCHHHALLREARYPASLHACHNWNLSQPHCKLWSTVDVFARTCSPYLCTESFLCTQIECETTSAAMVGHSARSARCTAIAITKR